MPGVNVLWWSNLVQVLGEMGSEGLGQGMICTRPWRNGVRGARARRFLHTSLVKRGSSVFPSCAGIVENGCGQLEPKMRRVTPETS